jgi:hypothetical protein
MRWYEIGGSLLMAVVVTAAGGASYVISTCVLALF